MEFQEWFNREYLQWQLADGKRRTVGAFARYLGIPQTVASSYLNGKAIPRGKNLIEVGKRLPGVYGAVGLPYWQAAVLGDDLAQLEYLFGLLPPAGRPAVVLAMKDALSTAIDYEDWPDFVRALRAFIEEQRQSGNFGNP